jgi:hypothetical protein
MGCVLLQERTRSCQRRPLPRAAAEQSRTLRQCSMLWRWLAQQVQADSRRLRTRALQLRATATQVYETAGALQVRAASQP